MKNHTKRIVERFSKNVIITFKHLEVDIPLEKYEQIEEMMTPNDRGHTRPVDAIKLMRECTGLGLKESKCLIDNCFR